MSTLSFWIQHHVVHVTHRYSYDPCALDAILFPCCVSLSIQMQLCQCQRCWSLPDLVRLAFAISFYSTSISAIRLGPSTSILALELSLQLPLDLHRPLLIRRRRCRLFRLQFVRYREPLLHYCQADPDHCHLLIPPVWLTPFHLKSSSSNLYQRHDGIENYRHGVPIFLIVQIIFLDGFE